MSLKSLNYSSIHSHVLETIKKEESKEFKNPPEAICFRLFQTFMFVKDIHQWHHLSQGSGSSKYFPPTQIILKTSPIVLLELQRIFKQADSLLKWVLAQEKLYHLWIHTRVYEANIRSARILISKQKKRNKHYKIKSVKLMTDSKEAQNLCQFGNHENKRNINFDKSVNDNTQRLHYLLTKTAHSKIPRIFISFPLFSFP